MYSHLHPIPAFISQHTLILLSQYIALYTFHRTSHHSCNTDHFIFQPVQHILKKSACLKVIRYDSCILVNYKCFDIVIAITKWIKSTMPKFIDAAPHGQPTRNQAFYPVIIWTKKSGPYSRWTPLPEGEWKSLMLFSMVSIAHIAFSVIIQQISLVCAWDGCST